MPPSKRQQAANSRDDVWIAAEEGDELRGKVIDLDTAWSDARAKNHPDGWYPLLTVVREDDKIVKWHAFETVAYNEVIKHEPMPGETIRVVYLGEGKAKENQSAPKLFKLVIDGRDPGVAAQRVYGTLNPNRNRSDGAVAQLPPTQAEQSAQQSLDDRYGTDLPE